MIRGRRAAAVVPPRPTEAEFGSLPVLNPEIFSQAHENDGPVGGRHLDGSLYLPYTADDLAEQAHGHTYQALLPEGAYVTHPDQLDIVGANGRRLILRWVPEGIYVGGCLITDPAMAEKLAEMVTREDDDS